MNNISFNTPPIFRKFLIANKNIQSKSVLNDIEDTFVKSSKSVEEIQRENKLNYLNKILIEVYNDVIADMARSNPIISKMNLPMPTIYLLSKQEAEDANFSGVASYNPIGNEIRIPEDFDKNEYIFVERNENGFIENYTTADDTDFEEGKKITIEQGKPLEFFKLNKAEKELQLKETFAHELRHFVQQHAIFSLNEIGQEVRNKHIEKFTKLNKMKQEYIEDCIRNKIEPDNNLPNPLDPTYLINYTPSIYLPKNALFKFNSDPNDNRYWSISEEFHQISNELSGGDKYYYGRPTEIDAYNYELEYLERQKNTTNVRPEIYDFLIWSTEGSIEVGMRYYSEILAERR